MTERVDLQNGMSLVSYVTFQTPKVVYRKAPKHSPVYIFHDKKWWDRFLWRWLRNRAAVTVCNPETKKTTWHNLQDMQLSSSLEQAIVTFTKEQERIPHILIMGVEEFCQFTGNTPLDFDVSYSSDQVRKSLADLKISKGAMRMEVRVVPWMKGWLLL